MRVLVCGSRGWTDETRIFQRLSLLPFGTEIISGAASGADSLAAMVAQTLGFTVREFPADWNRYGRSAGFMRNFEMLNQRPDLVIAFWDGQSRGTAHTIRGARARAIPVEVIQA